MSTPTRRGALGAVLGAALGCGMGLGIGPLAALSHGPIGLPETPQRLTRRTEHSLGDGNWIKVQRNWQLIFTRQGHGISVTGEQISANVDAPPSLAPIAAIEESRSTASMWPILLNESGLIVAAGKGVDEEDMAAAVALAERMIAARPIPQAEIDAHRQHLAEMQKAGSSLLDVLPDDLFFPTVGPMHAVRQIALPDGMTGEFEFSYFARAVPERGWLDQAERTIITRLAGTERIAREYWQLQQA